MDPYPKPLLRFQWSLGFTAACLLILGLDIALVYLGYRLVTLIF